MPQRTTSHVRAHRVPLAAKILVKLSAVGKGYSAAVPKAFGIGGEGNRTPVLVAFRANIYMLIRR